METRLNTLSQKSGLVALFKYRCQITTWTGGWRWGRTGGGHHALASQRVPTEEGVDHHRAAGERGGGRGEGGILLPVNYFFTFTKSAFLKKEVITLSRVVS